MSGRETGWTADFVYRNGGFESGVAMFADEAGRITRLSREPSDLAQARRFSNRVILPGLVNAHSHSFQRAIRGRTEERGGAGQDTFWTWRERMYRAANRLSPEDVYDVARMAFFEMLCSGVTSVGEFHYLHNALDGTRYDDPNLLALHVVGAARETGIRIVLLRTAYLRAGYQKAANPLQARFITPSADTFLADTEALRNCAAVGIAPHSVRALPIDYLREIVRYAHASDLPVHMHVAEQPAEVDECIAEYGRRPVQLLTDELIVDSSFTAVHGIYVTEEEIQSLGEARATVCACPTTERNLGDGAVPADRLMAAGAGICFGSDSNVQIDVLEDARCLEYHLRMKRLERAVLAPERLLVAATESGAAALGMNGGSLEAGRPADFFTLDLNDASIAGADEQSLLANIVFSTNRTAIRDVFVNGAQVIRDGRHALEEEIVRKFAEVQRRLWA